jgi:hypothetical protein
MGVDVELEAVKHVTETLLTSAEIVPLAFDALQVFPLGGELVLTL